MATADVEGSLATGWTCNCCMCLYSIIYCIFQLSLTVDVVKTTAVGFLLSAVYFWQLYQVFVNTLSNMSCRRDGLQSNMVMLITSRSSGV